MKFPYGLLVFFLSLLLYLPSCGVGEEGINIFPPEEDVELGRKVSRQIEENPNQFPILPEGANQEIYEYVRGITRKILNSGEVKYRDMFAWEVQIIDDDETLNAFATPGGYIYVYTGLIKFLDSEDELAGVLAHEIAHAALRHSTQQMTKAYGLSALVSIITGDANTSLIEEIGLGLINLSFSRSSESQADAYSVLYLCETSYDADGSAGFFEKVRDQPTPPTFLSTHPSPDNRVEKIQQKAQELDCGPGKDYTDRYQRMKALLD